MRDCLELDGVTLCFRMSYHKVSSARQVISEFGRRVARQWQPSYFTALNNISLSVRDGEIVGIVGRNGSGKSTLLRTISGIYSPDSGKITVSGKVTALLQLGAGFNMQLSGRENIVLGGLILGFNRHEICKQMEHIIDFAELGDFIDVPMRYYSSGMMSRLSFAMVISQEPDILLIDETLSVGDLDFTKKSQKAMRDLFKKARCQMIVSHSMETISDICTRAIWIERGQIVMDDKPELVVDSYTRSINT